MVAGNNQIILENTCEKKRRKFYERCCYLTIQIEWIRIQEQTATDRVMKRNEVIQI